MTFHHEVLEVMYVNERLFTSQVPFGVVAVLTHEINNNDYTLGLINHRSRIRISYGNPDTGRDLEDVHEGYAVFCSSSGEHSVRLKRAKNTRIGHIVRPENIVKIVRPGRVGATLYRHPLYHTADDVEPAVENTADTTRELRRVVLRSHDGEGEPNVQDG